jgi:predicted alpha/beta hydrolase family esterase
MKTLVFLSGFAVPSFISKSSWFFEENFWENFNCVFYKSKTPTSDEMVTQEIENLNKLISPYQDVSVIGHSLGCWWASNLACHPSAKINKLALWTPLGIANKFFVFTSSNKSEPLFKLTKPEIMGPDKSFVIYANKDLIVPHTEHALPLAHKFQAASLELDGGHIWQSDHKKGLLILKDWLKL